MFIHIFAGKLGLIKELDFWHFYRFLIQILMGEFSFDINGQYLEILGFLSDILGGKFVFTKMFNF